MKHIVESIKESLMMESADKAMRMVFGKTIVLSDKLSGKFSKLGMDFRHIYDRFELHEDGCICYTNEKLFTGEICAKVYKGMLNRIIQTGDDKTLTVYGDNVSGSFDMSNTPRYYIKAILNSLTNKHYSQDPVNVIINDLDYTSGDYEKDKSTK